MEVLQIIKTYFINFQVLWCGFNNDDTFFITLTESVIRIWDSVQRKVLKSVDFSGYYGSVGSFHPDGSHVLIASKMNVSVYTTPDIELQADYEGKFKKNLK